MTGPWRPKWAVYGPCGTCDAAPGEPCTAIRGAATVPPGTPMVKPHLGRVQANATKRGRRPDEELRARRLRLWKQLATDGVSVTEIAYQLKLTRSALDQFVVRARKRGEPDAVYHSRYLGASPPGQAWKPRTRPNGWQPPARRRVT